MAGICRLSCEIGYLIVASYAWEQCVKSPFDMQQAAMIAMSSYLPITKELFLRSLHAHASPSVL